MKVLIADDTRSARRLLERTLQRWGYEVVSTADGREALAALADADIHLAILDWMMPRLDGIGVCEHLQELDRFVYTILLTSKTEEGSLAHALDRGASDFVHKPFEPAELRARVRVGERIAALHIQLQKLQRLWSVGRLSTTMAQTIKTSSESIRARVSLIQDGIEEATRMLGEYGKLHEARPTGEAAERAIAKLGKLREESDLDVYLAEIPTALGEAIDGLDRVCNISKEMASYFGPNEEEKAPTNINAALRRILPVTPLGDCELELDLAEDLPPVNLHLSEFNQMMSALLVNAVEAIAERGVTGQLYLRTRRNQGWVEIWLRDNGVGIPEDVQSRVFDPFYTTKEKGREGEARGQGLSHARVFVVDEHHGSISVDSREGEGTTVRVRLPIG